VRTMQGQPLFAAPNTFAAAPLLYKNWQGWTSRLHVQNTGEADARLKVTFLDKHGDPVSVRQLGPLCPRDSLTIDLETVGGIPYQWVGSAWIESFVAKGPPLATPWVTREPTSTPVGTVGPTQTVGTPPTPQPTVTPGGPTATASPAPSPTPTLIAPATGTPSGPIGPAVFLPYAGCGLCYH
jgi:hypothetical protein